MIRKVEKVFRTLYNKITKEQHETTEPIFTKRYWPIDTNQIAYIAEIEQKEINYYG